MNIPSIFLVLKIFPRSSRDLNHDLYFITKYNKKYELSLFAIIGICIGFAIIKLLILYEIHTGFVILIKFEI